MGVMHRKRGFRALKGGFSLSRLTSVLSLTSVLAYIAPQSCDEPLVFQDATSQIHACVRKQYARCEVRPYQAQLHVTFGQHVVYVRNFARLHFARLNIDLNPMAKHTESSDGEWNLSENAAKQIPGRILPPDASYELQTTSYARGMDKCCSSTILNARESRTTDDPPMWARIV